MSCHNSPIHLKIKFVEFLKNCAQEKEEKDQGIYLMCTLTWWLLFFLEILTRKQIVLIQLILNLKGITDKEYSDIAICIFN